MAKEKTKVKKVRGAHGGSRQGAGRIPEPFLEQSLFINVKIKRKHVIMAGGKDEFIKKVQTDFHILYEDTYGVTEPTEEEFITIQNEL
jgi:hypothetical protein